MTEQSDGHDSATDVTSRTRRVREGARSISRVGLLLGRLVAGTLLVLYAMSFVAPPPVERAPLDYSEFPESVAHDAVQNLRSETYRYTYNWTSYENGTAHREAVYSATVDNRARQYSVRVNTRPGASGSSQRDTTRAYGTLQAGFRNPANVRGGGSGLDILEWEDSHRADYSTSINAFRGMRALREADARVVTDNRSWYVVRFDDESMFHVVPDGLYSIPGETATNTSLTLGIRKDTDRLGWATFQTVRGDERIVFDYRFERGVLVDVDRPVGTYPPGSEVAARVDLGIRAVEALVSGGGDG